MVACKIHMECYSTPCNGSLRHGSANLDFLMRALIARFFLSFFFNSPLSSHQVMLIYCNDTLISISNEIIYVWVSQKVTAYDRDYRI